MNPEVLKKLWEQRSQLVDGLRSMSEKANPTAEDVQTEERMLAELKALDVKIGKGIDEAEREQRSAEAYKKYEGLTNKGNSAPNPTSDILLPNQSMAEWAQRKGLNEGYEGRSFGRYLRDLVHSAPLEQPPDYEARFVGEGGSGGNLVPTPLAADVIDLARNATRVIQAGAVTVPMTSATLKYPRLTGEGSPAWHAEHAQINDADLVFE